MNNKSELVLKEVLDRIELPEYAYEQAERRYTDIGEWLHRPESTCILFKPLVFSQGSFRLGTAIRPEVEEEYDLDLSCKLSEGLTKATITQQQLKELVGHELALYRTARNINKELVEKRRCWRLEYADGLSFHMDIVPCIPEDSIQRELIKNQTIALEGFDESLAYDASYLAVSITDNTDIGYTVKTSDWRISNPEGYARWFESRMRAGESYIANREIAVKASIDELPYFRWKTPLQSAIQLLKRHRDTMFKISEDSKPISAIITTLAARAYKGESDVTSALSNILNTMDQYVNDAIPHVPNPVNPKEDFADKWYSKDHAHLRLKENFGRWLIQAKSDFAALGSDDSQKVIDAAKNGVSINLDKRYLEQSLGFSALVFPSISTVEAATPRPWCKP